MSKDPIRILLAEDNRAHQHLLLLALAAGNPQAQFCVVDSGAGFERALSQSRFDCAVVDFNLPDCSADQLISEMGDRLGATPVIVISSSDDQRVAVVSFRCGVVDFLPKHEAVIGDQLWRSIERAVESFRQQRRERRQHERRQRALAKMAETDPLTGLGNRRYFQRCLDGGHWKRDRRQAVGCLMLDLDHFKQVNDTYGHAVGDDVLKALADVVRSRLGSGDTAIRWGGEEFLLLNGSATLTDAWYAAELIRRDVAAIEIEADGRMLDLSVSIGVASLPGKQLSERSVSRADEALYLAKRMGRNQVCSWPMVQIEQVIDSLTDHADASVERKRQAFLSRVESLLGPTQRQHVGEHCQAVADLALRMAQVTGADEAAQKQLTLCGMLHDIGKCMIPEGLLAKPRTLSIEEWALMSKHCDFSARIAQRLGAEDDVVQSLREHHTRHDAANSREVSPGTSWLADMICVADAVVTMLSERNYQPAHTLDQALAELDRERGRQFAPRAVDAAKNALASAPQTQAMAA